MAIGVGTSFEQMDDTFTDCILPLLDVIEITPDILATNQNGRPHIPNSTLKLLSEIAQQVPVIVHGIGLSIGSFDHWNEHYLQLLDQLFDAIPIQWHSEHLGFTTIQGNFLGSMLTLPRTTEVLDLLSTRVELIQARYPVPFLLENVVNLLPDPPSEMSEAAFLNQITKNTGCELLLDLYNLECNAHNQNYRAEDFLQEINLSKVREIHMAGGTKQAGLMLDVHSRRTQVSTQKLLAQLLARPNQIQAVIYELMPQALPTLGYQAWIDELNMFKQLVKSYELEDLPA